MEDADQLILSLNSMTDPLEIQNVYNKLLKEMHEEGTIIPITRVKGMAAYNTEKISNYTFYNQPDYMDVSSIKLK